MLELRKMDDKEKREEQRKLPVNDTVAWLRNAGAVTDQPWMLGDYEKIKGKWNGQPCYVVGTGPTLKPFLDQFGWNYFDGKHTIGINHAIEDYDRFEWFFFLDKRFLDLTTYDMNKYKGLIIAQNTTGLRPAENIVTFKCRDDMPTEIIEDGIYSPNLSGLAALHVAIISGADPIYLIGHGMGDSDSQAYHYREDYTGEVKDKGKWKKFYRVRTYFDNFSEWRRKIFSISDYREYTAIKNISLNTFRENMDNSGRPLISSTEGRLPRIAHLSFSCDLAKHADTTRQQVCEGYGIHKLLTFNKAKDFNADLFVINHFLGDDRDVQNFPYKNKAVDIVHTRNCVPRGDFAQVVAMSDYWVDELRNNGVDPAKITVIPACLDCNAYQGTPGYNTKTFGRITRWSPGKIPEWWNGMLTEIFRERPDSKCLMYTQLVDARREHLRHHQMIYDETVFIFEKKYQYLSQLDFYVHANGYFVEIAPHAILEAMATGLPVVYLYEDSLAEMVGPAGIPCADRRELKAKILELLSWPIEKLQEAGHISKERVKVYDKEIMLEKYNSMIKKVLEKIGWK